ncbi:hypothetical protein ACIQNU_01040 [Streptomyces sp. NPDC091292]|uniref:hypothetical protein n=1 Tax=Streptomyces sp. NPDC091292 TaxID=3365991 RepID=UPI0037FB8B93
MNAYRIGLAMGAVAVWAGATGCTIGGEDAVAGSGDPSREAIRCDASGFTWGEPKREVELTGVSDLIQYSGKGEMTADVRGGERHYTPNVSGTSARLSAAQVIKALGAHLKTDEPLAAPGDVANPDTMTEFHSSGGHPRGAYYSWSSVSLVSADFTHPCASGKGRVVTWEGTGTGLLSCADRITWTTGDEEDRAGARVIHEAAVKVCPKGSAATRTPDAGP